MGQQPRPTRLRLIEGARIDKVNQNEPEPRSGVPDAPEKMAADVREIWDYTVRELDYMKLLYRTDRDALICYCEAVVNHRKASNILAGSQILVLSERSKDRPNAPPTFIRNPALAVQRDAAQVIRAFAQEFGLTPSARARIAVKGLDDDAGENPFAATG